MCSGQISFSGAMDGTAIADAQDHGAVESMHERKVHLTTVSDLWRPVFSTNAIGRGLLYPTLSQRKQDVMRP